MRRAEGPFTSPAASIVKFDQSEATLQLADGAPAAHIRLIGQENDWEKRMRVDKLLTAEAEAKEHPVMAMARMARRPRSKWPVRGGAAEWRATALKAGSALPHQGSFFASVNGHAHAEVRRSGS